MTIGTLVRASGLARSTLLYYDRLGLLKPSGRTAANYRTYSPADVERLEQIRVYRHMGIPLKEIGRILSGIGERATTEILSRRLRSLEREISDLRRQQRCIVEILKQHEMRKGTEMLTKERWVAVMRAAGMDDRAMHDWHIQFERMEPEAHGEFLESLGINETEISDIRQWSRTG